MHGDEPKRGFIGLVVEIHACAGRHAPRCLSPIPIGYL